MGGSSSRVADGSRNACDRDGQQVRGRAILQPPRPAYGGPAGSPCCFVDASRWPRSRTRSTRLGFDAGQPYETFRARSEAAVPELDPKRPAAFAGRGAGWQEVVADADAPGPYGFLLSWRSGMTPVMSLAGDTGPCTAYLMGDHAIAGQTYQRNQSVMLYAPPHHHDLHPCR